MALLEWRDDFQIGIAEVDHEHQELIALINTLHELVAREGQRTAVGEFLGELSAQIAAHFALEEKVMRAHHYVSYDDHKQDHERLLDEIRDIMDGHDLEGRYDSASLSATLDTWFSVHFRTHDARLHAAVATNRL